MTDKEKIRNIIELFIAWNGETEAIDIANLDSAVDFIADSLQEESIAPKVLEDMLNAKTAAESLGISQEEHDRIVDELIYGKDSELVDDLPNKEEEPISEDLEQAAEEYEEKGRIDAFVSRKRDFINGAEWQKEQDKEIIELAEDHAMFAGMEKMRQQMMAKAVETTFNVSLPSGLYDKLWIKGCKEGDKLLVIKKDEL